MARAAEPDFSSVLKRTCANPRWMVTLVAQKHNVGHMNWRFPLYYAGLSDHTLGSHVSLYHIDTFDQHPFFLRVGKAYLTCLTPVLASDNEHVIILSNLHRYYRVPGEA